MMKKTTLIFFAIALFLFIGTYSNSVAQNQVTFNVDMTDADPFNPDTEDVFITGTFANWSQPGSDNAYKLEPLTPGSMIYTLTISMDTGEIQYKYFRIIDGIPSWDDGEWAGDPNRTEFINSDVYLENTWADKPVNVFFNVDMTDADPFNPETDDVYITGDLANSWSQPGTISRYKMTPTTGNPEIYTLTLLLYNNDYRYKYFRIIDNEPSWDHGEWVGDPNREITIIETEVFDDIWGDFTTGIFTKPNILTYNIYPNPVEDLLNIDNTSNIDQIDIYDITGKMIVSYNIESSLNISISVDELQSGIYIANLHCSQTIQTSKFIKN